MREKLYFYAKKQSIDNGEVEYLDLGTDEVYSFTKNKSNASLVSQEYIDGYFLNLNQVSKDELKSWNLVKIKPNQIDFIPKVEELNRFSPASVIAYLINKQNDMGYNFTQFKINSDQKGMHNFIGQHKKDFEDKGYTILLNVDYNNLSEQDVILWGSDTL